MEKGRIIVVDDEASVLRSLNRALRVRCKDWSLGFYDQPSEAIAAAKQDAPWVVVSDYMMDTLDGEALLTEVSEVAPSAIRVMLSGDISDDTAVHAAGIAHFLLPKPFSLDELVDVLERATILHRLPLNDKDRNYLAGLKSLPVLPKVYQTLSSYLNEVDEPENNEIANIIVQDPSILSKLIQIANSSFFGFASKVTTAEETVNRLGQELVKRLVLSIGLFTLNQSTDNAKGKRQADAVALQLREMYQSLNESRRLADEVYILGLFHNIAFLIPEDELAGNNLDVVGAYLLELWGFDGQFVETVLWQSQPLQAGEMKQAASRLYIAKLIVSLDLQPEAFIKAFDYCDAEIIELSGLGPYLRREL